MFSLALLAFSLRSWAKDAPELEPLTHPEENWSIHYQITSVTQGDGPFHSPYSGENSLSSNGELRTSMTTTLFLGRRLWRGAEIYFNPEISAGQGLSLTHGVAGFPNGEVFRVDTQIPRLNLARLYLQQVIGFDASQITYVEPNENQLATKIEGKHLLLIGGKFSLNDFFDNNRYAHDPRTQFLNWSMMDNGAWDYAADTRGYTWGFVVGYQTERWAVRFAPALVPTSANSLDMDLNIAQARGDNLEGEVLYAIGERPGVARLLAYANHAHMGSYAETLANPAYAMDITQTRQYRTKYGLGLNMEQEITPELGAMLRIGWNDGKTESWTFTEVDRTFSLGISWNGTRWKRPADYFGLAGIWNGISKDHADYLASGGLGFILGDGRLTYAPEQILETYYLFTVIDGFNASLDYQFVKNPGYNQDRGPASIYALRLHYEF